MYLSVGLGANLGLIKDHLNSHKKNVFLTITIFFLLASVFFSLLFFMAYWEANSIVGRVENQPDYQYANGTVTATHEGIVTVNNYSPWVQGIIRVTIYKERRYSDTQTPVFDYDNEISLEQETYKITFADNTVYFSSFDKPPFLNAASLNLLSETVVTVNWTVITPPPSPHEFSPDVTYFLKYDLLTGSGFSFKAILKPIFSIVPEAYQSLFGGFLFFCFSTLTGFIAIVYVLRDKLDIKKSYVHIRDLINKGVRYDTVNEVNESMTWTEHGPTLLGSLSRIAFGLSLLILKIQTSISVKQIKAKCLVEKKKMIVKELAEDIDIKESKISDLIPEKQTILVLIGLLTSLGLSFAFNMNIILPLLLSIVIFYVFLNIGAILYFTGKSKETALPLLLFIMTVVAASFQMVVSLIRSILGV